MYKQMVIASGRDNNHVSMRHSPKLIGTSRRGTLYNLYVRGKKLDYFRRLIFLRFLLRIRFRASGFDRIPPYKLRRVPPKTLYITPLEYVHTKGVFHPRRCISHPWSIYIPRVCSVWYRYSRYRYGCRTELTEVSGTGIEVVPNFTEVFGPGLGDVPNLPKCPAPVRKYIVPNLPNFLVPVLMSYRT